LFKTQRKKQHVLPNVRVPFAIDVVGAEGAVGVGAKGVLGAEGVVSAGAETVVGAEGVAGAEGVDIDAVLGGDSAGRRGRDGCLLVLDGCSSLLLSSELLLLANTRFLNMIV